MKFKGILGSVLIAALSLTFAGCVGLENKTITSTGTLTPSPTRTKTLTPLPSATSTIPPTATSTHTAQPSSPREMPVHVIPLAGPIASPDSQISGMTWNANTLIILPQYPEKNLADTGKPSLFALPRKDVLDYLAGSHPGPLTPSRISFDASNIASQIPGYEGYEAIAFEGEQVYLTIEANDNGTMLGFLVKGKYQADLKSIELDPSSLTPIPIPVQIFNLSYETLIIAGNQALTLFEANGVELNPNPIALAIDQSSFSTNAIGFNNIEYRLTDATTMDENGRFWVTNIFMPIEFWLYTISDSISEKYGKGDTHAENINVERMLELQYNGDSISLTETEPVQIELIDEFNSRNWEALVILEDMGFLAMTDTYPDTILAFIPFPSK